MTLHVLPLYRQRTLHVQSKHVLRATPVQQVVSVRCTCVSRRRDVRQMRYVLSTSSQITKCRAAVVLPTHGSLRPAHVFARRRHVTTRTAGWELGLYDTSTSEL